MRVSETEISLEMGNADSEEKLGVIPRQRELRTIRLKLTIL